MRGRLTRADGLALVVLLIVWVVMFGRTLWLPVTDRLMPAEGDFYGQFLTFSTYQYDRLTAGEIPLWNPYNNGGLPFIADTQAAVFYPPRLIAVTLARLTGGWSADALLAEGLVHFLIASLGWYGFLRVLTHRYTTRPYAAFAGTIVAVYGGFLMGYPLLQLAILEAAVWLPFVLLGIFLATRTDTPGWLWLMMSSGALGVSWLAGHPQTSWFCTMLAVVWLAYRSLIVRWRWHMLLRALLVLGIITLGITAVTLLPGLEYLRYTTRADLDFAAKANGFPLWDVVQFLVPNLVSLFSPLFIGVTALGVALGGLRRRAAWFWGVVAVAALLLSFGGNAPFYGWLYPLPTGLSFFRGQERFAFVVNAALAVMTAYGITLLDDDTQQQAIRRGWWVWLTVVAGTGILIAFIADLPEHPAALSALLIAFVGLAAVGVCLRRRTLIPYIVCPVITLELSVLALSNNAVFVTRATLSSASLTAALIQPVQQDAGVFRVDGFRGLRTNYASQIGIQDIRGISPLFLASADYLINANYSHNPLAWELFAVKYVYSDRLQFGTPTRVIAEGQDQDGRIVLHELLNPRPFAHLVYHVDSVDSDEFAWALLHDPRYTPRDSVVLLGAPIQPLASEGTTDGRAEVTMFTPEAIEVTVSTSQNAVLSLAMVDYVGWQATLDTQPVPIRRAYGALMAIEIPAGSHSITLTYRPLSFMIGAIISAVTWAACLGWALWATYKGQ